MRSRRLRPLWVTVAALACACSGERPAPSPSPAAAGGESSGSGLRPLTSRDEAKPFAAPSPSTGELPPGHPPIDGGGAAGGAPVRAGAAVSGTVTIAPGVAGRTAPTDVLYLIARSRNSKTVVAVRKEDGARFPHAFELSGADAMTKDQPFVGPFDITARLSKSGDAIPAPGDLEGTAANVAEGARGVSLVIEKVRQ